MSQGAVGGLGVKRLLREYRELEKEQQKPDSWFRAYPLQEDLFEWHFTIKGPEGTPFEGGFYHGKILLPPEYPFKPPDIVLLTPNGRFETGQRICLSVSSFHEETWQPSWSIYSILLGLRSLFPCKAEGVGALQCDPQVQRRLARASLKFHCRQCNFSLSTFKKDGLDCKGIPENDTSYIFKAFYKLFVGVALLFLFAAVILFSNFVYHLACF